MATDSGTRRTRRALLAGGLAAGAAAVASTLVAPRGADAFNGETVTVGSTFTGTTTTGFNVGTAGVPAVEGASSMFIGVLGGSDSGIGTRGTSSSGPGVRGDSISSVGVFGTTDSGVAVEGITTAGIGVKAISTTGIALRVEGKASFARSGRASVPKHKNYVDITVAGGLAANSVVHATLQAYRIGVSIAAVRTNFPVAGKARIYLTKVASTTVATSVGWFVAEY